MNNPQENVSPYELIPEKEFKEHWPDSEGRKPGTLGRQYKVGQVCPLFSERMTVIPMREWSDIIDSPDYTGLWPAVPIVLDQDGVGSCASESATGTVLTCRSFHGQEFTELNPYYVYHTVSGGRDSGSGIDANLRFVRDHGIAPTSVWPRSKGFRATPSAEANEAAKGFRILEFYDITNAEEFGSALLQGFAVSYGRRGHSIYGIDVISTTKFRMQNSWGAWGDKGTAIESFSGVQWGYGAWAVRVSTNSGESPFAKASEFTLPSPRLFEKCPIIAT